mgnify:CR=1 FL=1
MPRMRRVSRNWHDGADVRAGTVMPRMRRVSRNQKIFFGIFSEFRHASYEACE